MEPFVLCHECAERLHVWMTEQEAQETQEKHILTEDEIPHHTFVNYSPEVILNERNLQRKHGTD